jgi:hypothetical protein
MQGRITMCWLIYVQNVSNVPAGTFKRSVIGSLHGKYCSNVPVGTLSGYGGGWFGFSGGW